MVNNTALYIVENGRQNVFVRAGESPQNLEA